MTQTSSDAADKIFDAINTGNICSLAFLVLILNFSAERISSHHHRRMATTCFALAFLFFCFYGFQTIQPKDTVDTAFLALRGLFAGGIVYGLSALAFALLTTFVGEPYQRFKVSSATRRRKRSKRREELEKKRLEEEQAERDRQYLRDNPPLSPSEMHEQQLTDARDKWERAQQMINSDDFDDAETRRSLKLAKQKYYRTIKQLIEE